MNSNSFKKSFILISAFFLILLLVSCTQKNQKPSGENTDEKPPQSLTQLEQNIEAIIDSLDKEGKIEKPGQQGSTQGESKNIPSEDNKSDKKEGSKGSDTGSGSSSGGGSESGDKSQQGGQGQQQQQQQAQPSPWIQDDKLIKQILMQWNEFQPSAVKSGASPETIQGFGTALDNVANDISVKNLMNTLNDANEAYKYIPEFFANYKDKSVDVKRLKYLTRDVMYKSRFDKWDLAEPSMTQAKNMVPNLRSQATDQSKQMYQSLEYGVSDLEKVFKQRQKSLTQIKGNIILENIKSIEQFIKNESQKQKQNK